MPEAQRTQDIESKTWIISKSWNECKFQFSTFSLPPLPGNHLSHLVHLPVILLAHHHLNDNRYHVTEQYSKSPKRLNNFQCRIIYCKICCWSALYLFCSLLYIGCLVCSCWLASLDRFQTLREPFPQKWNNHTQLAGICSWTVSPNSRIPSSDLQQVISQKGTYISVWSRLTSLYALFLPKRTVNCYY